MASHLRFEERPRKLMTAKFTHIGRGLFPLPRGEGQGEAQTGTSVFTVRTERRKQEPTEYLPNRHNRMQNQHKTSTSLTHTPGGGGAQSSIVIRNRKPFRITDLCPRPRP